MALSQDPEKRARSLANLEKGRRAQALRSPAYGTPTANPRHPLFESGNQVGRTHGGKAVVAPELLETKTREITAILSAAAPVRDHTGGLPAADVVAVRLLADTLCRLDSVSQWLAENGLFDGADVRPAVTLERQLRSQALEIAGELGMTPKARAALGVDLIRGLSAAERLDDHLHKTYDAPGTAS